MKTAAKMIVLGFLSLCVSCERHVDSDLAKAHEDTNNSVYNEEVVDYSCDTATATSIRLLRDDVEITGAGAIYSNNQVVIQSGGEYWVRGKLDNGQLKIAAGENDQVKLILENAAIACATDAAIFCEEAERLVIILAENSQNTLCDGNTFSTDEINATLFSKTDLAIGGTGVLNVSGQINDAVASKDGLVINSGTLNIRAADDGIRGKDYLVITSGTFSVNAGGDAFKSDNEVAECGIIELKSGDYTVSCGGDAFAAQNKLSVVDGIFDITCTGTASSSKALKAGVELRIAQGDFNLNSTDDAIHSDQDVYIEDGNFLIATGDDGVHAENTLEVSNGTIIINESYEGLEAKSIVLSGGLIVVNASDDGINAASGNAGTEGQPQQSSGDNTLSIRGGQIIVYSGGDGVDVNGSVIMSGGTLLVHGPTANDNGPLDYDGTFVLTGGLVVASGSSGMAQMPSASSTQNSVLVNFTSSKVASAMIHVEDASGTTIFDYQPAHNYQSVCFSLPTLTTGTSYTIFTGGSCSGTSFYGMYSGGSYTPGDEYDSFTITSVTTQLGSSSGGPGGGPGGGGLPPL